MAWHNLTDIKPDLSLDNCWLNEWEYIAKRVCDENGKALPFSVLGVTDGALNLDDDGNEIAESPLVVGIPYSPKTFKPILNAKAIGLLKKATDGKDMHLTSCGTIANRGRQFFSFQLGDSYRAAGRDFVPYYNVGNGNDMSSPLWQNTSSGCVVCQNTFELEMLGGGLIMAVKKTQFSEFKIAEFGKAAKAILTGHMEFAKQLESLAMIKCNEDQAREWFAGFVGKPGTALATRSSGIIDRMIQLYKGGAGNNGENFADVFSAVTDYYTHESANGDGTQAGNWKNFVSSEFGSARTKKMQAWANLSVDSLRDAMSNIGKGILKETAKAK